MFANTIGCPLVVRHRIDGLEKQDTTEVGQIIVRHRIDGLESQQTV